MGVIYGIALLWLFPLICTFDKSTPTMFMLWTLSNRKAKYSLPEGVKPNLTKSDADISFGYSGMIRNKNLLL